MALPRSATIALALVLILSLPPGWAAFSATAQDAGATMRVSVSSSGTQGNGNSGSPDVSADGRFVAFSSSATNLVWWDANGTSDAFVHDRVTGETTMVSVGAFGQGDDYSSDPVLSADGRYVAFYSQADNLVTGDTNSAADVFVHDRDTGQTRRVSIASDGTQGNGDSLYHSISADARFVAFSSEADTLVPGDTNGTQDVFIHDRSTRETLRASVGPDGLQSNGFSGSTAISADGRYVAFHSWASNLVPDDTNGVSDVFVYDRQTRVTARLSVGPDGAEGDGDSLRAALSGDGRVVAFQSEATNLVPGDANPAWSAFVHDRQTGQTVRIAVVTRSLREYGGSVAVSADGRYVAFSSDEPGLVPDDTNPMADTFLYDRYTGDISRASLTASGGQANEWSWFPSLSQDGRHVVFFSWADNLVPGDTNATCDVFVRDRGAQASMLPVSGRVTDASGAGIRGVTISADSAGSAITNLEGYYSLSLPTGDHTLRASKINYAFAPDAITVDLAGAREGLDWRGQVVACALPALEPFLAFPLAGYRDATSFADAARDTDSGGLLTSWFDHDTPEYGINSRILLYTSKVFADQRTSSVGEAPCFDSRCYDGHNGYDIVQPSSATTHPVVYAAGSGTVVAICDAGTSDCRDMSCGLLGRQVWIDHGNGYATVYGHLHALSVITGTEVSSDTPIGTMGCTGNSFGPHLHFSTYFNHGFRDPWITSIHSARSAEVVDPFGWDGWERDPIVDDPWTTPSVNLWTHAPRVARVLDARGGLLRSPSGWLTTSVPSGVFSSPTLLALREGVAAAPPSPQRSLGRSAELRILTTGPLFGLNGDALGVDLAEPLTLTLHFAASDVAHLDQSLLAIRRWDEPTRTWNALSTTVDLIGRTATAQSSEPGTFALHAPLLCREDTLEINDSYATASTLVEAQPVPSLLDVADDVDWFRMEASAGTTYSLWTTDLGPGVDTVVELYAQDALTLLARNDDALVGAASHIVWQAPASGTYYVRVLSTDASVTGCQARYTVVLEPGAHRVMVPMIVR